MSIPSDTHLVSCGQALSTCIVGWTSEALWNVRISMEVHGPVCVVSEGCPLAGAAGRHSSSLSHDGVRER